MFASLGYAPYWTPDIPFCVPFVMLTTQTQQEMTLDEAFKLLAEFVKPEAQQHIINDEGPIAFIESNFYIPELRAEHGTMKLTPHQKLILNLIFDPVWAVKLGVPLGFQDVTFSTIKKSGKTSLTSAVARWVAERWGYHNEIYALANDEEQARGRIYQKIVESISLDPDYNPVRRILPGRWRIIERDLRCLTTETVIRAVSSDYKGEAGSNPTMTVWSELWGFSREVLQRLWDELTPVPTRKRSMRWVETYAGFAGESSILKDRYNLGRQGRQLTIDDVPEWGQLFPQETHLPIWILPEARMFTYWDEGVKARRMPWQTGALGEQYYREQAILLRPLAYARLHENAWVSATGDFIPIEWWDRQNLNLPKNADEKALILKHLKDNTPSIASVDASVTNDCTGTTRVVRHPTRSDEVVVCPNGAIKWQPSPGMPMDYDSTLRPQLEEWCRKYNVVQIPYDAYQLHYLMTQMSRAATAWCKPFSQNNDRNLADKQLEDLIRNRKIWHFDETNIREHIQNAAAKSNKDENTKLRIVKKAPDSKIDLVVCLSMASFECLRLNI